jgi:hypothetical protein
VGHVPPGGPGQFFHADLDGLLTPEPVQVLSVGWRQDVKPGRGDRDDLMSEVIAAWRTGW